MFFFPPLKYFPESNFVHYHFVPIWMKPDKQDYDISHEMGILGLWPTLIQQFVWKLPTAAPSLHLMFQGGKCCISCLTGMNCGIQAAPSILGTFTFTPNPLGLVWEAAAPFAFPGSGVSFMAEAPDGSHIPAVHVAVGWRGQRTTSLMDFGLHTHHPAPYWWLWYSEPWLQLCCSCCPATQCLLN